MKDKLDIDLYINSLCLLTGLKIGTIRDIMGRDRNNPLKTPSLQCLHRNGDTISAT